MNLLKADLLFATPVFSFSIEVANRENILQEIRRETDLIDDASPTTLGDLHLRDAYSGLCQEIHACLRAFWETNEITNDVKPELTCMWASVQKATNPHADVHSHAHSNSFLSGVVFLAVDEKSPPLVFEDPRPQAAINNLDYKSPFFSQDVFSITPRENLCVLFPSWLKHKVPANTSSQIDRVSIAFNVFPRGQIGTYKRLNYVNL